MPMDTHMIGYTDDIALVVTGTKLHVAEERIRTAIAIITDWFRGVGLSLAEEKTELMFLNAKSPRVTA